jgi:O-antigen/teichoic acid export membrane protein
MTQGNFSSIGRRLLSGSLLRMSNLVAGAVASFFLMPFIVHHLGDRIYGFWSLAAAFIGYYSLLDLGLSSAISQYMCIAIGRKDHPECRVVFNTAFGLQLLVGVAALLVTGLVAAATPLICHNPADARLFWKVILILGVNTALGFPTRVYWAVLEAQLRFDVQSWLANLGLALRTGLIVWAVLSGGGLLALSWMALISTVPVTALQVWLARREAPWARIDTGFFKPKIVKSFFSYSFYSFTVYLGDIVRFQIDPLVISGLIGLAAVTHYKVAGVLAQYYLQIIIVSVGMLLPVLSRFHGAGNRQALEEVFFFGTKLSCCVSVLIFFGLAGWGQLSGRIPAPGAAVLLCSAGWLAEIFDRSLVCHLQSPILCLDQLRRGAYQPGAEPGAGPPLRHPGRGHGHSDRRVCLSGCGAALVGVPGQRAGLFRLYAFLRQ